jgi:hypothetical protein
MKTQYKVSLSLYVLLSLLALLSGIMYLAVPTVMPYHQQALGVPWNELGEGPRVLLWMMVKLIGAEALLLGISSLLITLIPFRKHERWAVFALPALAFLTNCVFLFAVIFVRYKTGAETPVWLMSTSMVFVFAAFFLSLDYKKA